jgi:hypothetical protein
MALVCSTRALKNAKFLQAHGLELFPPDEPLDGFASLVPMELLRQLERIPIEEIDVEELANAISRNRPASGRAHAVAPLFSGTLRFVNTTFKSAGTDFVVPAADLQTALKYTSLAVGPISEYASQYGPNSLSFSSGLIPFNVSLQAGKYNDSMLAGWADQLAKANSLSGNSCLVFLNPQGVVNTDADVTQGILGYHNISPSGIPYAFVNVMGTGLTVRDERDLYASALSHETSELTVDPAANGSNPEVSDACSGNCSVSFRNYFDESGNWMGGNPIQGYAFFTAGIATPATVAQCPAPVSSCSYPPPRPQRMR